MKSFQITPLIIKHDDLQNNKFHLETNITDLKKKLNDVKSTLDDVYKSHYAQGIMNSFDPFIGEKYNIAREINAYNLTNAWLKCYEIIDHFNLIPKIYDEKSEFVYFDNASYPGSFIVAVNHYVKTQTNIKNFKWYGSSLKNKDNLGDDFNLQKNFPKNWLMHENNDGDLVKIENILDFNRQLKNTHGERVVNMYSCDLSLDWGTDYNNQESISFNENLCQILCGLLTLKSGGHLFVKHFTLFEPFTIAYLSLLTLLFNGVYITKPISSKRTNSETYIVCKNYKYPFADDSIEYTIIQLFINTIKSKKIEPLISSDLIKIQMEDIYNACKNIYNCQITALLQFKYSVNHIKDPMINEKCFQVLQTDNTKIVNEFKKINIKPIHTLSNLCMFQRY